MSFSSFLNAARHAASSLNSGARSQVSATLTFSRAGSVFTAAIDERLQVETRSICQKLVESRGRPRGKSWKSAGSLGYKSMTITGRIAMNTKWKRWGVITVTVLAVGMGAMEISKAQDQKRR